MKIGTEDENVEQYSFGEFLLDPAKRLLFRKDGGPVPLMPKAFDILVYLVERGGKVVEKDELMSTIWPDTIVEENNLTQNISALRKALGEKHRENRFIATVPGRGYKFVADIQIGREADQDPSNDVPHTDAGSSPAPRYWLYAAVAAAAAITLILIFGVMRSGNSTGNLSPRSLAVLPFKPVTAGTRDEPLEMGMADTLIMKLGGQDLVVRPLSTVRRFGALDQDPLEAGKELGVDAVLDGRIQIIGDRVRVATTLIRVSDGRQLWAGSFDEQLTDIFSVQDSISDRVAVSLKLPLQKRDKRYTRSIEAYQLYMKAVFHVSKLVGPEVEKGIEYLRQAIELDPEYAMAYVALANAYRALVLTNDAPAREMGPKSKAAAEKAVALDPELAESWSSLATANFWFDFDWKAAEQNYKKALDLDPNSAAARMLYAHLLSNLGRSDEALAEFRRARQLDPVSLATGAAEGQALFFAGRDDDSIAALVRVIDLDERFWLAHLFMTRPLIRKGNYVDALAAAEKAANYSGGNSEALATIGYIFAVSGQREKAIATERQLEKQGEQRHIPSYVLALIPAGMGEKERALTLLERSVADRDALLVFLKVEPKWNTLRNEERFTRLLSAMNFDQ